MAKAYRVWIQYFDCNLTRRLGRRVSRELCVNNPTVEELLKLCSEKGLVCRAEDKKHPRTWYQKTQSLIIVEFEGRKPQLVKVLAQALKNLRMNKG